MLSIDLNCDVGESFGRYTLNDDEALMRCISSANIACGYHAGDPAVMQATIALAIKHNVAIGAHPGLPDLQGFGRRALAVSSTESYQLVLYQIGALHAFAVAAGTRLHHVKPHGALYNMAAEDAALAEAIAKAVYDFDRSLILYGLAGSKLVDAGEKCGLRVANEVFADRTYTGSGTLTPRSEPGALISNAASGLKQAMYMIKHKKVRVADDIEVDVIADTICLHGDGEHALKFATTLHDGLTASGITIKPI